MRMRNLPWAKDYLETMDIVKHEPTQYKGKWKELLGCDKLHVEIGSGKGDYWLQMADMYPDVGWIGIEKNVSVSALAIKKYEKMDSKNTHMAFIQDDAEVIEQWFDPCEVDVIHLNFSDPWPKKRAHKKRLSHEKFISQYHKILSDDGEIRMKTDNQQLFEYSILEFQRLGWYLIEFSVNFRRDIHDEDAISEYEHKFMEKGQPIYRAVWKKAM